MSSDPHDADFPDQAPSLRRFLARGLLYIVLAAVVVNTAFSAYTNWQNHTILHEHSHDLHTITSLFAEFAHDVKIVDKFGAEIVAAQQQELRNQAQGIAYHKVEIANQQTIIAWDKAICSSLPTCIPPSP